MPFYTQPRNFKINHMPYFIQPYWAHAHTRCTKGVWWYDRSPHRCTTWFVFQILKGLLNPFSNLDPDLDPWNVAKGPAGKVSPIKTVQYESKNIRSSRKTLEFAETCFCEINKKIHSDQLKNMLHPNTPKNRNPHPKFTSPLWCNFQRHAFLPCGSISLWNYVPKWITVPRGWKKRFQTPHTLSLLGLWVAEITHPFPSHSHES